MATGILILFYVAILNFGISSGTPTLKHVIVTYRSPEHTPCDFTDGPVITKVPESNSTLTEKGVNRTYDLGKSLGDKYKTQLGITGKWSSNDYHSMGTPAPRCQMAALNFGAGLEESEKVYKWESEQQKKAQEQNVTFPHTDQYLRFLSTTKCPGFYQELQKKLPTWISQLNSTYSTKLPDLSNKYPTVNASYPYTIWLGYEIFLTQNETNHTAMTWLTDDNWAGLSGYSEDYIYDVESEVNLKKLTGGIMVDSILNVTDKVINGSKPQGKKKDEDSSHKMSVLAVSQAPLAAMLGAFTPPGTKYNGEEFNATIFYPRNGAHHVVEIYAEGSGDNKKTKIKVLYSPGGDNGKLSALKYQGCNGDDDSCTYEQLTQALKDTRLPGAQQDQLCKKKDSGKSKQ